MSMAQGGCTSALEGTFNYLSTNMVRGGNNAGPCGDVVSGTVTWTDLGGGLYSTTDFSFGQFSACWSDNPAVSPSSLIIDDCGNLSTSGTDQYGDTYNYLVTSVVGPVMTIIWTNTFGDGGTVQLTRQDNLDWEVIAPKIGDICQVPADASLGLLNAPQSPYWSKYTSSKYEQIIISSVGLTSVNTDLEVYPDCLGPLIASSDDFFQEQSQLIIDGSPSESIYILWKNTHSTSGFDWAISTQTYLPVFIVDSLALTSLFITMDGQFWDNNKNWLSGPVDSWQGIKTANGRVTAIDLSSNSISGALPFDLSNLTALESLILRNNDIVSIPDLSTLTALKKLDVDNTAITEIPGLGSLNALEELGISGLGINLLQDLKSLPNLTSLTTRNNNLSDLTEISSLTNLKKLDLGENPLAISPDFAIFPDLEELIVDNAGLNQLTGLSSITNLSILNVTNNNLENLDSISNLLSLSELYAINNRLADVSALNDLLGLRILDIGDNPITIPADYSLLINLEELTINNTRFMDLPDLSALLKLTILNLNNNNISDISGLTSMSSLVDLDVANNRLDFADLEPLISDLDFNYNPQKQADPVHKLLNSGDSLTMEYLIEGTEINYQWQKNGISLGDSTNTLTLSDFQVLDQGSYEVFATSSAVAGLTLSSLWSLDLIPDISNQYFDLVTTGAVVEDVPQGTYGSYWIDYDNDGDEDLYVNHFFFRTHPNYFYENNGDGTFTKIESGEIANTLGGRMVSWGDYNNDSYVDLLVSNFTSVDIVGTGLGTRHETAVFQNNGDGSFTQKIIESGLDVSRAAIWGDYDNDGLLDIFRSSCCGAESETVIFQNNGDGTFTETNTISDSRWGDFAMGAFDADNDLDLDFFMIESGSFLSFIYLNDGDGNYTEQSLIPDRGFFGGAWADYDNDGDIDLFLPVGASRFSPTGYFLLNDGSGSFTTVPMVNILGENFGARGATFGDIDNDGFVDLITWYSPLGNVALFINNTDGTFTRVQDSNQFFANSDIFSGLSMADYDNDGFLDLFVPQRKLSKGNALYRNIGNTNNWLKVKLVGIQSNRSAIGARVAATVGTSEMTRYILSQSGFIAQNSMIAHFGVGITTTVDKLTIYWPSGIVQVVEDVAVNQLLTVVEELDLGVTIDKVDPVTCANDGSLTINTTSGTGLTYSIDGGLNFQASNIFNGLAEGSYTVIVKNDLGNVTNAILIDLTNLSVLPSITVSSMGQTSCDPANLGGEVSVTADGGIAGFTFEWWAGIDTSGPADFNGPVYSNIPANDYTVIATDSITQCSALVVVVVDDSLVAINVDITTIGQTTCDTANPTGEASATINGDATDFTFEWWNGTGTVGAPDFAGAVYSNLVAGNYTVRSTNNATLCSSTISVVIVDETETVIIDPSISKNTSCENFNGSISISDITPGVLTDYSFAWYFGNSVDPANLITGESGPLLTNLEGGIYTVVATHNTTLCENAPLVLEVDLCTALAQQVGESTEIELVILPNPSHGTVKVQFSNVSKTEFDIKVFDFSGRIVIERTHLSGDEVNLNTNHLRSGVFILMLHLKGRVFTSKFVVD